MRKKPPGCFPEKPGGRDRRRTGAGPAGRTPRPSEEIDAAIERRNMDLDAPLTDQLRWMEEAGFRDMDCMYKYLDFAVFFGRK